jgi:hypothetical protein
VIGIRLGFSLLSFDGAPAAAARTDDEDEDEDEDEGEDDEEVEDEDEAEAESICSIERPKVAAPMDLPRQSILKLEEVERKRSRISSAQYIVMGSYRRLKVIGVCCSFSRKFLGEKFCSGDRYTLKV